MRQLIKEADPDVVEEWKRRGTPVWSHPTTREGRHHLHGRILQEGREADLRRGRVSEGSGWSLQLEPRRTRTPCDRHPRRRRSRRVRLQGARSPSGRPQQFWQVETFEESEVLRDSAPEQVRHRGGGGVSGDDYGRHIRVRFIYRDLIHNRSSIQPANPDLKIINTWGQIVNVIQTILARGGRGTSCTCGRRPDCDGNTAGCYSHTVVRVNAIQPTTQECGACGGRHGNKNDEE